MIRRLDATTIGQIAAGEVVERPFSVVKELVENSLDAGAARIAVAVARGGLDAVEVTDDGAGIPADQLSLALERHATSKLADATGLERIATLGFRGEGLASIAAVARVRIVSRTAGSDVGYAVDALGGEIGAPEPAAAAPGTKVSVRDLFITAPVRREFLRSSSAEFARISAFLATLSLAYPEVTFSLAHDGRSAWVLPGAPSLEARLAHVFGPGPARALIPLEEPARDADVLVRGYVSRPGSDRADRRMQTLFVNGRLLRSTLLAGAWSAAYATYALAHRQPYGVLFLSLAPDRVDPNVHPTKSDVRLRRPDAAHDAVRRTIASALARDARGRLSEALSFAPPGTAAAGASAPASPAPAFSFRTGDAVQAPLEEPPAELRILAQLDDTFVLATDGRALVLVDQHAAHERVAFEAIAERARRGAPVSEPLLVPYSIELDAAAAATFEQSRAALAEAGFEAEPFGERTYRIVATPAGYGARAFDVPGYIAGLADETPGLDSRERIWASLACHSVTRAGERLEEAEMSALLAQLVRCANPMHCPHGRPTIVRIEADAIARMFKRG